MMRFVRLCSAMLLAACIASSPLAAQSLDAALAHLQRQEFDVAVPMLKSLAEKGSPDAAAYLGGLYLTGIGGVPHDPSTARTWLEQGARGGNATAAFDLGLMFERGEGVAADPTQSFRWYELAAQSDFAPAMLKAGKAYLDGSGTRADKAKAATLLKRAAEIGDPDAQNLYAIMIANKETAGTPAEAYSWFMIAERAGQPDARGNRDLLRPSLTPAEIAEAEDRSEHWRPMPAR